MQISNQEIVSSQPLPPKSSSEPAHLRMFFGHHKCASGWIDNILREICLHMGIKFKIVHQPYSFDEYGTLGPLVKAEKIDFLAYINTNLAYMDDLPPHRGFHVVRDPRDIVVSAYFSHRNSLKAPTWSELGEIREKLQGMSKEEGLMFELEYLRDQFERMHAWDYEQPHVLELQMERLSAEPLKVFIEIMDFLEMLGDEPQSSVSRFATRMQMKMNRLNHRGRRLMPAGMPLFPVPRKRMATTPPSMIAEITEALSFKKLAGGRKKGQENTQSHYRKGVHGDWRNHFNEAHLAYFRANYNDLVVKLGYEAHLDWE